MTAADKDSVVVDSIGQNEIESNANFVEWQQMSVEDALAKLKSSPDGLSESEISARQSLYGTNEINVDQPSRLRSTLWFLWNPLAWMLELAVLVALIFGQWMDASIIVLMLVINALICFYGDNTSSNAASQLKDQLALKCHVKRGGTWREIYASQLTIGDVVSIQDGDVVPADCKLLTNGVLRCDEAALTGQEKSSNKNQGDVCFSGAAIKTGTGEAVVFAIGNETFFGKAVELLSKRHKGRLQSIMTNIGNFSISFIAVMIVLEIVVQVFIRARPWKSAVANVMVLIIGAVPIAMPTVLSMIMALGAIALAKRNIIVRRLTAIEELASMDILCANKSGTICTGQAEIVESETVAVNGHKVEEVLFYAAVAAEPEPTDDIDKVVTESCPQKDTLWVELERLHYVPFDPLQKRTIASVRVRANGNTFRAAKGAPWVMMMMDQYSELLKSEIETKISDLAGRGHSVLGVAVSRDPADMPIDKVNWELVGLLAMKDPLRADCANSLQDAKEIGVDVKLVTGEQLASAVETCKILGVPSNLQTGAAVEENSEPAAVENADGFAELFPKHKFSIVDRLQKRDHIVGISGTSVNDCAALQKADIGIAVPGSVVSARSASDVVLLVPGLAVIIEAVMLSRTIFRRIHAYVLFNLVATVQIVLTFGLLTLFYDWYFPAFCILIMTVLNHGALMTISKDNTARSSQPERWNLRSIFIHAFALGVWLSLGTLLLFVLARHSSIFTVLKLDSLKSYGSPFRTDGRGDPVCNWELWFSPVPVGLSECRNSAVLTNKAAYENNVWRYYQETRNGGAETNVCLAALAQAVCGVQQTRLAKLRSLIYLVVSITGHAVIFSARTKGSMWRSRPSNWLIFAFFAAQLISTLLGTLGFGRIFSARTYFAGVGPATAIFAWFWAFLLIIPLDFIKMFVSRFTDTNETDNEA